MNTRLDELLYPLLMVLFTGLNAVFFLGLNPCSLAILDLVDENPDL